MFQSPCFRNRSLYPNMLPLKNFFFLNIFILKDLCSDYTKHLDVSDSDTPKGIL